MTTPEPASSADVRRIRNSRIISAEAGTSATIVCPALPVCPGDYKVSIASNPRWFLVWGRRRNSALCVAEKMGGGR